MHCDVAYKPRKIVIEMRVRFRLKPEAYGLVKQVVEEDAHWVAGNTAGALSDFRKKSPANCGVFCFKSVCSGIGFGARLRYGREGRFAVPDVSCRTY